MIQFNYFISLPISTILLLGSFMPIGVATESHEEVRESTKVVKEINRVLKTRIPSALLRRSQAIAILTNVIQGGFIFGVRRGGWRHPHSQSEWSLE